MSFDARRNGCRVIGESAAVRNFPRRPNGGVLSELIPLFFIGRNALGFWVAREATGSNRRRVPVQAVGLAVREQKLRACRLRHHGSRRAP